MEEQGILRGENQPNAWPDRWMKGPVFGNNYSFTVCHKCSSVVPAPWKMIKDDGFCSKKRLEYKGTNRDMLEEWEKFDESEIEIDPDLAEAMREEYKCFAEDALAHYNKEKGVDYELVRVYEGDGFSFDAPWFHVNFEAKPRNSNCPPQLFFGEVKFGDQVTHCSILEPDDFVNVKRCQGCVVDVHHPAGGFQGGYGPFVVPKSKEYLFAKTRNYGRI